MSNAAKYLVVGDSVSDVYSKHRTLALAERAARNLEAKREQYPQSPYFAAGKPRVVERDM